SVWMALLILPLAVQWWSVWYPGAEPGGGSFIAQRVLAAKNEQHAIGATLLFNVMHYAARPWPWILVAMVSLVIFPTTPKAEQEVATQWLEATENRDDVALYKKNRESRESLPSDRQKEIRQYLTDSRGVGALAREFPNVEEQFVGHDMAYP